MCLLAATPIFLATSRSAFGSGTADETVHSPASGTATFSFEDADGIWSISIAETSAERRTTVLSPSGNQNIYVLDKQNLTLYSSATNQTIDASDAEPTSSPSPQTRGLGTVYPIRRSKPTYYYRKYSFAKIKAATKGANNLANIAGAIATLAGAGTAAAILNLIKGLSGFLTSINKGSTSHGIQIKFRKVRVYEYHDFQQKWIEINPEVTIAGIGTY